MDRDEEIYACAVRHDRWEIAQGWVDHEQVDTVGTSTVRSGPDGSMERRWADGGEPPAEVGDTLDDAIAELLRWRAHQLSVRRLAVHQERRWVRVTASGGLIEDTEEYVSVAITWDPASGMGAATRELAYWRVAPEDVASVVDDVTTMDLDMPSAVRPGRGLAAGPLLFSPYATAQLLDRMAPSLYAPSAPGYRHSPPLDPGRACVIDGVAYGGGRHRAYDDERVELADTVVADHGMLVQRMGRRADAHGHPPTGHGFRSSHRDEVMVRPRALRLSAPDAGYALADLTDVAIVHSLQQLRTGSQNDPQFRFVARVVGPRSEMVLVPMRTTVRRLLAGVLATFGAARPFPLAQRVLGATSLFAEDAMTWEARWP